MAFSAHFESEVKEIEDEEGRSFDAVGDQMALAVLEFQAKNMVGLTYLPGAEDFGQIVDQLKDGISEDSARQTGAVAAFENFIALSDDANGKALAFIDEALEKKDSQGPMLVAIRLAIADPSALGDEEWRELERELGWFAELLAAAEGGPRESRSTEIRESCKELAKQLMIGVMVLVGAGLVGSILLFVALYRWSYKKMRLGLVPPRPEVARVLMGSFAIYIGLMAGGHLLAIWLERNDLDLKLPILIARSMWVVFLVVPMLAALAWAFRAPVDSAEVRQAFGMHRGRGVFTEICSGLVGYVAMLPVVAMGLVGTILLVLVIELLSAGGEGGTPAPIAHPLVAWMANGDLKMMLLALFLASVLAPLFEETMFRGAFHGALRGRWRFMAAALASAVVFAAVHPQGLLAIPALTAMGFGFAMIREWRGSLFASMTAHALHNGMLVGVMWVVFA